MGDEAADIPPEVIFASRYFAGDWTEGIVPSLTSLFGGWQFHYEGRWSVFPRQNGSYAVWHEFDQVGYVTQLGPDLFALDSGGVRTISRLDLETGVIWAVDE